MSYDIRFTDDEERRRIYGELPDESIDELGAELLELSKDPWGKSRVPPTPPFAPTGRLFDIKLRVNGRRHFATFLFHIDDPSKTIAVRRVMLNPPLQVHSDTIEEIGLDEMRQLSGKVTEIPGRGPK